VHKITLLASFAFGGWIDQRQVLREGIASITPGRSSSPLPPASSSSWWPWPGSSTAGRR